MVENIFKGERGSISKVNIEAPLAGVEAPCCDYYMTAFSSAAQKANTDGDSNAAAVYSFLQTITSFYPSFDTPSQPYVPWFQMDGKRGLIPSDLSPGDIEAVRTLSELAQDPALRARLYDVLWELTNDHKACAEAAKCYIKSAERLNVPEQWTFAVTDFKRGLYLAAKLGRNKELFKTAADSLEVAIKNSAVDTELFRCCQFLELAINVGCCNPSELSVIAATHAEKAARTGDHYASRHYRQVEAELHKASKNDTAEKAARIAAAEASVTEAEGRAQGAAASYMAAASLLSAAIEALRRAGGAKERINDLRTKLNEWQRQSLSEFKTVSAEINISDIASRAVNHVKDTDVRGAILKLAFGDRLTDVKATKDQVLKIAKDTPMSHLFGTSFVDDQGRTTAIKEGLLNLKGEEFERALEAEAFSHASNFQWRLRADAFINPARQQIFNDHKPTYRDLYFIVRNNPFIPAGHEGIFLRGIHAGFHGDFLVASHLLTPQIENSMRYVLESQGIDVSNLMSDGTQPVKILGAIFGIKETKEIFGDDLCFELRGSLIEKSGFDFRNRIAHGFVTEGDCYAPAAVNLWWLALRICLTPIYNSIAAKAKSPGEETVAAQTSMKSPA